MRAIALACALLASVGLARQVSVTAYALPGLTASGERVRPGTAAVSRDLLRRIPLGSTVRLSSVHGNRCKALRTRLLRVTDTMAPYIHNTVDLWVPTAHKARKMGRCKATLHVVSTP